MTDDDCAGYGKLIASEGPLFIAPFGGESDALVPYLPDVEGMTNPQAAEAYAVANIAVVPVPPGTKNPGGYLGKGWQHRATTDLDTVRAGWRRWPDAGIACHVGGSTLLVIDVDHSEHVSQSHGSQDMKAQGLRAVGRA